MHGGTKSPWKFPSPKYVKECLKGCSLAARGLWMEMRPLLRSALGLTIKGSMSEMCQRFNCDEAEFVQALDELMACQLVCGSFEDGQYELRVVIPLPPEKRATKLKSERKGGRPPRRREAAEVASPASSSPRSDADAQLTSSSTASDPKSATSNAEEKSEEETAELATKRSRTKPSPVRWSRDGGWEGITAALMAEWGVAHPDVDVDMQIKRMDVWLKANPDRAKKSNWSRFIVNWLSNEERGGPRAPGIHGEAHAHRRDADSSSSINDAAKRYPEPAGWNTLPRLVSG